MPKTDPKQVFDVHRVLPRDLDKDLHKTKPNRIKKAFLSLILILLALLIVIGGWDAINLTRASQHALGSGNILQILSPSALNSQNGRTNVLVVGYSVDDPNHPGADLTDSIMLLSLDRASRTGYMLSIPRDLYVNIPGYGYAKVNEAYQDGGLPLLEQVIASDLQQPINYYALVDYSAVRDSVNALGGITVDIQSPDARGLYDPNINQHDGGPLKLSNGLQTLDGQTALNLTRARGDAAGAYGFPRADFDRTQHQRQVFTAIKDKLSWTLVLNPLKNGRLFQAMGDNVKTNISLSGVRPLFGLFKSVSDSNLKSVSLDNINGQDLLRSYATAGGQDALIPSTGLNDYSQIVDAINQLQQQAKPAGTGP